MYVNMHFILFAYTYVMYIYSAHVCCIHILHVAWRLASLWQLSIYPEQFIHEQFFAWYSCFMISYHQQYIHTFKKCTYKLVQIPLRRNLTTLYQLKVRGGKQERDHVWPWLPSYCKSSLNSAHPTKSLTYCFSSAELLLTVYMIHTLNTCFFILICS